MDIPYLKKEFESNKGFLKDLYQNNPRKISKVLEKASDEQLKLIIKILHLISNGKISLRKQDFKLLKKSKRLRLFQETFEKQQSFINALKFSRNDKISILKKFVALFSILLYTMFNKKNG